MAQARVDLPRLEVESELWLDLEIPYGKFREKWDRDYEGILREHVVKGRIEHRVLNIYLTLLDENQVTDKSEALDTIIGHDETWGYNLLCVKRFADYKNVDYFKHFKPFLLKNCEDTDLYECYLSNWQSDNKKGLAALIQLFDPEGSRLKTIHGLDYCENKKPQLISMGSGFEDFDIVEDADRIVAKMDNMETRQYSRWHSFEYNGATHVMVKREMDDAVERQAIQNIEEEPAEFVVLRYIEGELEIISSTKEIAGHARSGINSTVEGAEFSEVDAGADRNQLSDTVRGIFGGGDSEPLEESGEYDLEQGDLRITGIKTSSSPLPGHPKIEMQSDAGIMDAIEALRRYEYDLTESIDDVEVIYTEFNDRKYTIRPKERRRAEDEVYWVFQYNVRGSNREERNEFEDAMNDLFDIDPLYEHI